MENLLGNDELNSLNENINQIKEQGEFLGLGVFPMTVMGAKRDTDKNGDPYLKIGIDTGFKKMNSDEKRLFVVNFHLVGLFPDGTQKVQMLARFLKRCFGFKEITNEALLAIRGKKISVATKKDANGFISYWYATSIDELKETRKQYKPKDESDGKKTWSRTIDVRDITIQDINPDDMDDLPF